MMKIERVRRWSAELEAGLSEVLGHDRAAIVEGVEAGSLEAYRLWDGAAYMVTRVERGTVTVCCYQGERAVDMTRWLRAHCLRRGFTAIRFYTQRPALARLIGEFGPVEEERVYRLEVA